MKPERPSLSTAAACVCLSALVAGCARARIGGSTPPDRVIAQLRQENAALRQEVDRLNVQIEARLAELEAQQSRQNRPAPTDDIPRLHRIVLASLSGAVDSDQDGRDDLLRLYVVPRDQHDRVLPVEGTAILQAVRIEPGQDAQVLAHRTFNADEFRAAYRSGLAGTHYTLELPLPPESSGELTVKVTLADAATGIVLSVQRPFRLRPASSPQAPAPGP